MRPGDSTIGWGPKRAPSFRLAVFTLGLLWGLIISVVPALAHVTEGGLRQEIVVEERLNGTTIWVKSPLPMLFGDEIAEAARTGTPLSSELLYKEQTGAGTRYRVDAAGFSQSNPDVAARLGRALQVTREAREIFPVITRWRLSPRPLQGPFEHPEDARTILDSPSTGLDPVFGQASLIYEMQIPAGGAPLSLTAGFAPLDLPPTVDFDTRILRHAFGEPRWVFARVGQLDTVIMLPPPKWQRAVHHVKSAASAMFVLLLAAALALVVRRRRRGLVGSV